MTYGKIMYVHLKFEGKKITLKIEHFKKKSNLFIEMMLVYNIEDQIETLTEINVNWTI